MWYCAVLHQCNTLQSVGCDTTRRNTSWKQILDNFPRCCTKDAILYIRKPWKFRLNADGSAHAVGWVVSVMHRGIKYVAYDEHAYLWASVSPRTWLSLAWSSDGLRFDACDSYSFLPVKRGVRPQDLSRRNRSVLCITKHIWDDVLSVPRSVCFIPKHRSAYCMLQ
jgi:hypothetical protein